MVAEVVPNGETLAWAGELALSYLKVPEVRRRNTRAHFLQPLKASSVLLVHTPGIRPQRPKRERT